MAQQIRKKNRRRYAAPIGGLFIVLAVIGVVTVVIVSIRMTVTFLDNDKEKEMFADLIRPVAMFDPGPFEDVHSIKMESLLRYSLWATIKSDKRGSYEYEESNELIIPASDVDVAAARLFGPDIELTHQSFGDYDITYLYEEEENIYSVPISAQLLVYEPEVVEITKDGEYLNLTVAYIPPATAWTDQNGPEPDKYMIYVMTKSGDSYQIVAVRDMPSDVVQAEPVQQPQSQSQQES